MRRLFVKKNYLSATSLLSFCLFFLVIGLLIYQLSKVPIEVQISKFPKEVMAITGTLNVSTGSSTAIANFAGGVWNSSGNVGIGTTTPTAKLDVVGDLKVSSTANICSLVAYTSVSGITYCPTGYYTWSATGLTDGQMLCCKVDNGI